MQAWAALGQAVAVDALGALGQATITDAAVLVLVPNAS